VTSRKQAVEMLRAKARASKPGEWVLVLGGWSLDQFSDSRQEFTKDELDGIAPNIRCWCSSSISGFIPTARR